MGKVTTKKRRKVHQHGAPLSFPEKVADLWYRFHVITLSNWSLFAKRYILRQKQVTVFTYPEVPRFWHMLYTITHQLGYTLTNNPNEAHDIAILFGDQTVQTPDEVLLKINETTPVLNIRAANIGKDRVEKIFSETFGYGMVVDPRTHNGPYVEKSIANAQHDGSIRTTPQEPREGFIYQRLIDTRDGETVEDIRVHVFGKIIPFVTLRYKYADDRFDHTFRAIPTKPEAVLSQDEIAKILRFCEEFGLDFGEIDTLRDNNDKRLYIVDANTTPGGPRPGVQMSWSEYLDSTRMLSNAFKEAFGPKN